MIYSKEELKGFALVIFSVLIWSGWTVISRFAVTSTLTAYDVTAIRFTVSGIILLPVIFKRGLAIGPWGLKSGFLLSLLVGACFTSILVGGMKFAPVSHIGTINTGTFLIVITLFGMHGLKEHISKLRLIGVALSLLGIAIMLATKGEGSDQQWIGHLMFIIAGSLWGSYVLLARHWRVNALHAAAVVCVFSMISFMPLYLLFIPSHITLANWQPVLVQAVYQGVFTAILALIAFNHGIQILGASRAGAFVPLIPAVSTLIAVPALHEVPTPVEIIGITTLTIGVFLATGVIRRKT